MNSRPELRLDWCSHAAAKYAVEHWHYSGCMPAPPVVKVGVWEHGEFIGIVAFSRGSCDSLGAPYGLSGNECSELSRIALRRHDTPVSRISSIATRLFKTQSPGVRLLVSYADPAQGHHGGIYQAMGWTYTGKTGRDWAVIDKYGKQHHSRVCSSTGYKTQFGVRKAAMRPQDGTRIVLEGKHRFLRSLDKGLDAMIGKFSLPYPRRVRSIDSDVPGDQPGEGGATPTLTLQEASDG